MCKVEQDLCFVLLRLPCRLRWRFGLNIERDARAAQWAVLPHYLPLQRSHRAKE